jgi:hypothetical protein
MGFLASHTLLDGAMTDRDDQLEHFILRKDRPADQRKRPWVRMAWIGLLLLVVVIFAYLLR